MSKTPNTIKEKRVTIDLIKFTTGLQNVPDH